MKIWKAIFLGCFILLGALAVIASNARWQEGFKALQSTEKLSQNAPKPLSVLCGKIDCSKFPKGYLSFVMTNGDILYTRQRRSGARCCAKGAEVYHDVENEIWVAVGTEKVKFYDEDFVDMGVTRYKWARQTSMYFTSSEKVIYPSGRKRTVNLQLINSQNKELDINKLEKIKSNNNFSIFSQYGHIFSIIYKDSTIFNHRLSVNCTWICNIISIDFQQGQGNIGLHVDRMIGKTLPSFGRYCQIDLTIQTCSEFSKNLEAYQNFITDIGELYNFLKLHPSERT